uniref:Uncharacterized protein n=1 Tax=Compsopogon caeruleus TaxID=31354 RepID=A0A7S1XC33_9RHOD|mmetsp:Transcript_13780/g.28290  ORF Transcript_13780/g.28290 Transcript_13780/m.28290 type:complete len:254 (+) Transcript_13780:343-1104(+)
MISKLSKSRERGINPGGVIHVQDWLGIGYGVVLLFFGAAFVTLIAAIEAVHHFGWHKIRPSLLTVYRNFVVAIDAWEKDNRLDEDRDGVADVKQLAMKDRAMRAFFVVARSVDPNQLGEAMEGLTMAYVAVIATLRVKFAQAITLGITIGENLHEFSDFFTVPLLNNLLPQDYRRWSPILAKYGCRYLGVTLAWYIQRFISAIFSSSRGAAALLYHVLSLLIAQQKLDPIMLEQNRSAIMAGGGGVSARGVFF